MDKEEEGVIGEGSQTEEEPQVFAPERDGSRWKFSRREFISLAALAAAGAVIGGCPRAREAAARPIQLVAHASEPPFNEVKLGQPFTKTWHVRNSSPVAWGDGATLRLENARALQAADSIALPNLAPGDVAAVRVPMVATEGMGSQPLRAAFQIPSAEGTYKTFLPLIHGAPPCTCVGYTPCSCDGYSPCTCVGDYCSCDYHWCPCDYEVPCVCDYEAPCPCDYEVPCVCDYDIPCVCDFDFPCACDYDCGCVGYVPCGCVYYSCGCVGYVPCGCVYYF